MTVWQVEQDARGRCDVLRDRRAFAYDVADLDEALARVRQAHEYRTGDEVWVVEPDGSRRKVRTPRVR